MSSVFDVLASSAMALLAVSNVYSTCRTLLRIEDGETERGDAEQALRRELQFWVGFVLVQAFTGLFREEQPEIQLLSSIVLVLCKHFDTEQTVSGHLFRNARKGLQVLDEHVIAPNTLRLVIWPCVHLLHHTLSAFPSSSDLSNTDRRRAAQSIGSNKELVRKEILRRDKEDLLQGTESSSSNSRKEGEKSQPRDNLVRELREKVIKKPPAEPVELSYGALSRYFRELGLVMGDEKIARIQKLYEDRPDVLRRKLMEKYGKQLVDRSDGQGSSSAASSSAPASSSAGSGAQTTPMFSTPLFSTPQGLRSKSKSATTAAVAGEIEWAQGPQTDGVAVRRRPRVVGE